LEQNISSEQSIWSLGGQRGGAQKQTTHQETKTKLSSAMPDHDKTIHCQGKRRKRHPASNVAAESAPHPRHAVKACANDRTIPNNMVLWQRLATCSFVPGGAMRPSISNRSPGSCRSVGLARALLFVKAAPVLAKKGHCSNLIFGAVNTLAFWTPTSGPPQLR